MEEGRGLSASVTGLMLLPMSVTAVAVSALTGRRPEVRGKLRVGATAQVLACAALLTLGGSTPLWLIVGLAILIGIPQGLVSLANQNALHHQADPERTGASAGLLRTFGYLGAIVASVGNGAFLADRADAPGLHHLAAFLLAVAGVFLAVTLADRSLRRVGAPTGQD
ncbi:MFS transporter [Pseudonocardia sp. NPDC049154]|uniref:MFS transporter n=1 Tax=Pseudonocardia sp. NPDC049154 TaxID=3155501 RepID=UPI0033E78B0C